MTYYKFQHRVSRFMSRVDLHEAGIAYKPEGYEVFRMFSPHAYTGTGGRQDTHEVDRRYKHADRHILSKFYSRFPGLKLMPQVMYYKVGFSDRNNAIIHPAVTYIKKFRELCKKGYDEEKAFSMVEAELNVVLEAQRDDMRIIRGGALGLHGSSYLDRAQKIAELES